MILFIVNPISGHGKKTAVVSRLSKKDCRVVYTEYAGHAEELARTAEEDIVVAVGGDGTVNEVARGLIGTGKTLGIIPRGSGDGLALHLGLSHELNRSIKVIENGKKCAQDYTLMEKKEYYNNTLMHFSPSERRLINPHYYKVDISDDLYNLKMSIINKIVGEIRNFKL